MPEPQSIACIIYGAKSTEDIRGSLVTQLNDCREAIAREGGRAVVAEYRDEAVSAYRQNRGAGLDAAMRRAAALAEAGVSVELWVQHSDRLARGDGRAARHLVEVALWALKASVVVRCVEDRDTFRDLLYAVVTGQRNHEDSRRKGAAVSAGLRRATERGEYRGNVPDGYRAVVEVDRQGRVVRRMEIDPERRPLIEMIFSLSRGGTSYGVIARKVNEAGWRTAARREDLRAAPFGSGRVLSVLTNPKYAGLSCFKGEIVGLGQWPAYISADEYYARQAGGRLLMRPRTGLPQLGYLLRRVAVCADCGAGMSATTNRPRQDGHRSRRYVCRSHLLGTCAARAVDADLADHAFVAHLDRFIGVQIDREWLEPDAWPDFDCDAAAVVGLRSPVTVALEEELRVGIVRAVAAGDSLVADGLVTELVEHRKRYDQAVRALGRARDRVVHPGDLGPLEALALFHEWSASTLSHGAPSMSDTQRLNLMVRRWFRAVELRQADEMLQLRVRFADAQPDSPTPTATIDIADWRTGLVHAGYRHRSRERWSRGEITEALRLWADAHGRAPLCREWQQATPDHPHGHTVLKRFGTWREALMVANLDPPPTMRRYRWTREDICETLRRWTAERGWPPRYREWGAATPDKPSVFTVQRYFGCWESALEAASEPSISGTDLAPAITARSVVS